MKGIVRPIAPARISPTIIKIAEVTPFFAAIPKISPSANSSTMETIPAMVVGGVINLPFSLVLAFLVHCSCTKKVSVLINIKIGLILA